MKCKFTKCPKMLTTSKLDEGLRFCEVFEYLYKRGELWVLYFKESAKTSTAGLLAKIQTRISVPIRQII
jgi:hypothetical protein